MPRSTIAIAVSVLLCAPAAFGQDVTRTDKEARAAASEAIRAMTANAIIARIRPEWHKVDEEPYAVGKATATVRGKTVSAVLSDADFPWLGTNKRYERRIKWNPETRRGHAVVNVTSDKETKVYGLRRAPGLQLTVERGGRQGESATIEVDRFRTEPRVVTPATSEILRAARSWLPWQRASVAALALPKTAMRAGEQFALNTHWIRKSTQDQPSLPAAHRMPARVTRSVSYTLVKGDDWHQLTPKAYRALRATSAAARSPR